MLSTAKAFFLRYFRIPFLALGIGFLMLMPPLIMALALGENAFPFVIPASLALAAWLPVRIFTRRNLQFRAKEGFLLVFLSWVLISLLGAFPYFFSGNTFTDAIFESACGFATTGATTLSRVESLPRSLLFWRSITHWFGGMGIVLFTVALLPLLGIGGFQLIKAETPGPEKEKVTPKITATAKSLWICYCGLTVLLVFLFHIGGMDWYDAVCNAFTVMASGGVSTKDAGLAYYDSAFIDGTATVFMLLAGCNFNLYYRLFRGKFRDIINNTETRVYLAIFIIAALVITVSITPFYGSFGVALRYASYQSASILSTTGAAIANYELWPPLAQAVLFLLMFCGGCSGSTAGGIKVIRHTVLGKQVGNELRRIIYPQGVFSVRLNQKIGRKDVVYGVASFVFLYLVVVSVTMLATAASGVDLFSSLSAALSVTGNMGVGFGAVGPAYNYGAFPDHIKWLFCFVMIAGRLELWTVFILFTPEYWRS